MVDIPLFAPVKDPVIGKSMQTKYRTLEAQFGDGYNQATIDGLNATIRSVGLKWNGLSVTDKDQIKDQFDTFAGTTFAYLVPGDSIQRFWRCKQVEVDDSDGTALIVQASLEQVFDLGSVAV